MNVLQISLWPWASSKFVESSRHVEMYPQCFYSSKVCKGNGLSVCFHLQENEWRRLETAQVKHQVFDLGNLCTQQPILLQLLRFHRSPVIPVHKKKKRKENRCFCGLPIVIPMNSETEQLLEDNSELEIFQTVRLHPLLMIHNPMDQEAHFLDDCVSAHNNQFQTYPFLSSYKHERTLVFPIQNISKTSILLLLCSNQVWDLATCALWH